MFKLFQTPWAPIQFSVSLSLSLMLILFDFLLGKTCDFVPFSDALGIHGPTLARLGRSS